MAKTNYSLWLNNIQGISNHIKINLVETFGGAREVYFAERSSLRQSGLLKTSEIDLLEEAHDLLSMNPDTLKQELQELGISFVSVEDERYPVNLLDIYDHPYGLYYRGHLPKANRRMTSIVGSRNCSAYGHSTAHELGYLMARAGFGVISGMARGIDSAAHKGALEGGGYTCAVLGCGVDICYPPENRELYEAILERGCVLSEFAPGAAPDSKHFPQRNRIISGLSDSVIVVEARVRSGSLITAQIALQQNRDVYAVPGRINDPMSEGTNRLIEQGAGIISSSTRFLERMGHAAGLDLLEAEEKKKQPSLNKKEKTVYQQVDYYARSAETLLNLTNLSYRDFLDAIHSLTSRGLVREVYQNNFVRT